ncbi:MAG: hypothetical protein J6W03_03565, partial [Bacteroidaceae bacterium]|nr:hypothetical protein [Bacteroidaceae bacterium]
GEMKADIITAASQLSNTKVYTIRTNRGYMTLNTDQTMIVSSHSSNGGTVNANAATDDASKQFGIINYDGKYFIYSPKLKKFACLRNQNLYMYTDRGIALDITTDGTGNPDGSTLRFFAYKIGSEGYNKWCLNNNNGGNLVLNNYTTAEGGNTVTIEEVAGVTLDIDAAMAVFNGAPFFYDMHKVYNITNERLTNWTANAANTGLTGTTGGTNNSGASDAQKQFAFFKYEGKQYLYNLGAKKFVATDGTLTPNKAEAATIAVWYTGNATYPYCFYIEERGLLFNGQGGGGFSINAWNNGLDGGNQHNIVEVAGVDAYNEILALFETPSWDVTYNLYYNGEKIGEEVRTQDQGSTAELTAVWNNNFVDFTFNPTTITAGVTSVDVTVNWSGPALYPNYESIVWKNLYIDRTEIDGSKHYLYNSGNAPEYLSKNPTDKQRASDAFQWGFVGTPYHVKVYNKLAGPTQTLHPNSTIEMADGDSEWNIKISYNGGFMIGQTGNVNNFINQYGGYQGTRLAYYGNTADNGNVFHFDDVPNIPVTNVYYDITFNGDVVKTLPVSGLEVGEAVPAMPTITMPAYTTVTAPDVTGQTVTAEMHIAVPATWSGPFVLSSDYATAHWYDMKIRSTWYVTSDLKDDAGALKTVNANALGLGEDAYHWAFIGDPWHIKLYNKAEGAEKVYAWTESVNENVPVFMAAEAGNCWNIKASTASGYTDAFMLTIPTSGYQVNQFGGAGGSLKIWNSTATNDDGSAFNVMEIPTDYSEFVQEEIAPTFESTAKYFVLNADVAATVGYDAAYKTSCTFEQYKAMKLAMMAIDMTNLNNFVLPETGYYTLKNSFYDKYMGIDPSDATMYGNYETAAEAKNIVKLTKTGANTYTISLMGKYAPTTVAQSTTVVGSDEAGTYTVFVPAVGYGSFMANPEEQYSALHCRAAGDLVGWTYDAGASMWEVADAESIQLAIDESGYATTYLPFPATPAEADLKVYTGTINGNGVSQWLTLSALEGTIPTATPVILNATPGTYTFTIGTGGGSTEPEGDDLNIYDSTVDGEQALVKGKVPELENNDLMGSFEPIDAVGKYILAQPEGYEIGFYKATSGVIQPCKAYLEVASGVKGFTFKFDDNTTGIKDISDFNDANNLKNQNGAIFNLAGQRLNKVQKGINIVNGKKVLY